MSISLQIVIALLNKESYNKYYKHVKRDESLKEHYKLLEEMHESRDSDIPLEDYLVRAEQLALPYLLELSDVGLGTQTLSELIRINSERTFAHTLGLVCLEVFEGRRELSDVFETYQSWQDKRETRFEFISDDLETLIKETDRKGGVKWRLDFLNETIGGLHKGDFGFVFARTNVGKTTFLVSEISHMLKQIGKESNILWINNEESGARIKVRLIQSYFGVTYEKLVSNIEKAQQIFNNSTNFTLVDLPVSSKRDIEELVKLKKPEVLIIDSLDAILGFKADRQDLVYGDIYNWARKLSQINNCVTIGVCQAASTADNKRWLKFKDIDGAHTAKAKHADFVIGIGKIDAVGMEKVRFISQLKNKFNFGVHRFRCKINSDIARFE